MHYFYTLLFLVSGCALSAQSLYFPPTTGTTWDTISPSTMGYCQPQIDSLYDYLEQTDTKAFILLKDGKIVLERYFGTFTQDSLWYWASAGKTMTAYLVGIAQQENLLDLSDPSSQYLGNGWTATTPAQEQAITIRHQLTMTSGLDDGVPQSDCTLDTCLQYLAPPDTRWAYHNAPYTLLDGVLQQATGLALNTYLFRKVKRPTGIRGFYLSLGYNNVYWSDARSFARFGLMTLAKGSWNGTPILSDTTYFNEMTTPSQAINPSYGYLWWLNGQASHRLPQLQLNFSGQLVPSAPADCIFALGKNGQMVNVVPSQNLVWVRMGNAPGTSLVLTPYADTVWMKVNNLVCTPLSAQESAAPRLTVFPNPSTGQVVVNSPQGLHHLALYNPLGQCVFQTQEHGRSTTVLHLSNLPKGNYILHATDTQGQRQVHHLMLQ